MIDSFSGQYAFLSNFWAAPFLYDGVEWPTVEHAFQAQKSLNPGERELIRGAISPLEAKRAGRQVADLRPDWDEAKEDIMFDLLLEKFSQNQQLVQELLATGDNELIEGNKRHDNIWGNCTCPRCQTIPGRNLLGKLLMNVREQLRYQNQAQ